MKIANYFLSLRNIIALVCIFFLSQNVFAKLIKYTEKGLAGDGDSVKVKIINRADYKLDSVTVLSKCTGKSVKRKSNLAGGSILKARYGIWYLQTGCSYTVSGSVVKTGKHKSTKSLTVYLPEDAVDYATHYKKDDGCKITFKSRNFGVFYLKSNDGCKKE